MTCPPLKTYPLRNTFTRATPITRVPLAGPGPPSMVRRRIFDEMMSSYAVVMHDVCVLCVGSNEPRRRPETGDRQPARSRKAGGTAAQDRMKAYNERSKTE